MVACFAQVAYGVKWLLHRSKKLITSIPLANMKFRTYLVGGALRDEYLKLPNKDLDYVVLAPSFDALRDELLADGCKIFTENPKCLTIRAKHPTLGCVDFACARKDGNYTDGRHPDSTSVTLDLKEDLARRDFTCNAMARCVETGEFVDPFDGRKALDYGKLIAVGSARARFDEDRLRPFRAIRFAVTKNLRIESDISNAIGGMTPNQFDNVSTERIREELLKTFKYNWHRAYALLTEPAHYVLLVVISERGIWFRPTTET